MISWTSRPSHWLCLSLNLECSPGSLCVIGFALNVDRLGGRESSRGGGQWEECQPLLLC